MNALAILAALAASLSWAGAAFLAHAPARALGVFEFTRVQLTGISCLLALLVTATGGWATVSWHHWPNLLFTALVGVLGTNLAMAVTLRRGGPRRCQMLATGSAPLATLLGWLLLGESLGALALTGIGMAVGGVLLAILFRDGQGAEPLHGRLGSLLLYGLLSALCHAAGLVAMKPVLLAGTDPIAAAALRTGGAAVAIVLIGLLPLPASLASPVPRTLPLLARALLPAAMGYGLAASLLLYALRSGLTGYAVVLGSLAPVMMLPLGWAVSGKRPPAAAWGGALLLVAGIGVMVAAR
jgi:drug/metabolite transporter (DMT)-like permease